MVNKGTAYRHTRICELLKEGKPISVVALSKMLGVSQMTIRRDFKLLEQAGKLRRRRGWAEPIRTDEYEPSYTIRAKENIREKQQISRAAAHLVKNGEVIIVDIGTTLLEFVRLIGKTKQLTVLTYWLPIALELAKYPNIHTILLGGVLRQNELSLVGNIPIEVLANFNPDRVFLSIGGISVDKGVTDYNLNEVEVKRAVIQAASEVIVAADHTKLDRVAPVRVAPLTSIHTLVTDSGISRSQYEAFRAAGLNVIVAEDGQEEG